VTSTYVKRPGTVFAANTLEELAQMMKLDQEATANFLAEVKNYNQMCGNLGPWEIGFVLIIVLIIFGPGKLPQIGESIGKAIKGFKNSQEEIKEPDKLGKV